MLSLHVRLEWASTPSELPKYLDYRDSDSVCESDGTESFSSSDSALQGKSWIVILWETTVRRTVLRTIIFQGVISMDVREV